MHYFDKKQSHQVTVKVKQCLYRPLTIPEGSRRLRLPDFQTIGRLYPEEILLVLISVGG
jgi:hypothetical protein